MDKGGGTTRRPLILRSPRYDQAVDSCLELILYGIRLSTPSGKYSACCVTSLACDEDKTR